MYFRRFYLNNSVMEHHPRIIMWVAPSCGEIRKVSIFSLKLILDSGSQVYILVRWMKKRALQFWCKKKKKVCFWSKFWDNWYKSDRNVTQTKANWLIFNLKLQFEQVELGPLDLILRSRSRFASHPPSPLISSSQLNWRCLLGERGNVFKITRNRPVTPTQGDLMNEILHTHKASVFWTLT